MVIQHFRQVTKGKMSNSSNHIETQNTLIAGFKAHRISTSKFFKKALKKEDSSKDEIIRKFQDENRELRQELNEANSRIRELESAAMANQTRAIVISPSTEATSISSTTQNLHSRYSFEYRDDDVSEAGMDDDPDVFSVEVEATTSIEQESFDMEDEIRSVSSSVKTIPTGNDKKSKLQRRQQEIRQKLRRSSSMPNRNSNPNRNRGEDAYLDYFSRRSRPLGSITEINTRMSLLDDVSSGDDTASTTSDLSLSIGSSFVDDENTDAISLMSGRKVPLRTMKSLLRSSSGDSESLCYIQDDESGRFGEI